MHLPLVLVQGDDETSLGQDNQELVQVGGEGRSGAHTCLEALSELTLGCGDLQLLPYNFTRSVELVVGPPLQVHQKLAPLGWANRHMRTLANDLLAGICHRPPDRHAEAIDGARVGQMT